MAVPYQAGLGDRWGHVLRFAVFRIDSEERV